MKRFYTAVFFIISLTALCLFFISSSTTNKSNWDHLTELRIYDSSNLPEGKTVYNMEESDLVNLKFTSTDPEKTKTVFSKAKKRGKHVLFLWKGAHMGTAHFENREQHMILISNYGGFFQDQKTGNFYEFQEETARKEWDTFISENIH